MRTEKYLLLALCLFILGTFISACGGGGKSTTPSDSSVYYYLLAQQNANNNQQENNNQEQQNDPTLPTLEVSQTEFNLFVEDEAKIEVTLEGKDVTDQVTYTSDEESIAIAEKERIEAKDKGTAKITVSLEGANNASFTVNVKEPIPVTLNSNVLNQLHKLKIIEKGYDDIKELEEIDIPATFTYEGTKYKIININYGLFSNCDSLKKVTLPDSLETITQSVFAKCSSLEEMTIRDDVVCIFPSAFFECQKLTKLTTKSGKEINIPDNNVATVDNVTFIGVKLQRYLLRGYSTITDVTISNGLTEIPIMAFYNCTSLKSMAIPDSVTTIGQNAFYNCNNSALSIDIPSSVTSIGDKAFYNVNNINISEKQKSLDGYPWGALNVTIINPQNN